MSLIIEKKILSLFYMFVRYMFQHSNAFNKIFHIHRLFVKGMYFGNIKVCGNNLIKSVKFLLGKIIFCNFYIRMMNFIMCL